MTEKTVLQLYVHHGFESVSANGFANDCETATAWNDGGAGMQTAFSSGIESDCESAYDAAKNDYKGVILNGSNTLTSPGRSTGRSLGRSLGRSPGRPSGSQ